MKSILLIGLGRFGRHIAQELNELGHQVMAIDNNEDRVNAVLSYVTNAQIGDSTSEYFLRSLGVGNFDVCIVTIGGNFQSSLETTSLLKELGAENVPVLTVLNKCDKLPELPLTLDRKTAAISAKTGMGLEKLLEKVALNLPQTHQHLHLLIPYDKSGLIGEIRQTGKVYTEEYREDGTYLDANVELKLCHRVQEYILLNE